MADHAKPPLRPTAEETAALRERVWKLRHDTGLSTVDIAGLVNRDRTTVSRMLTAVSRQLAALYRRPRFDPIRVIAVAADRFERWGQLAMQSGTDEIDNGRVTALALSLSGLSPPFQATALS
jgi:hypothetical protein